MKLFSITPGVVLLLLMIYPINSMAQCECLDQLNLIHAELDGIDTDITDLQLFDEDMLDEHETLSRRFELMRWHLSRGKIRMNSLEYELHENGGPIEIKVRRTGGSWGDVSVYYKTVPNTAVEGYDYRNTSGTLLWENGDDGVKSIYVAAVNDDIDEIAETLTVSLVDQTGGVHLEHYRNATITIIDDDVSPVNPGMIQFTADSYTADEGDLAVVRVARINGSNGVGSVNYEAGTGTAEAGTDYEPVFGTLSWGDGDTSVQEIHIQTYTDDLFEADETVNVSLSSPVNVTFAGLMSVHLMIQNVEP